MFTAVRTTGRSADEWGRGGLVDQGDEEICGAGGWEDGSAEARLARAGHATGRQRERLVQEVVTEYLPLARDLAHRYRGRGEPVEDLEQVAALALVLAAGRFDPMNGTTFAWYAKQTILGELRRHFCDRCWTVRPPRRLQELRPQVRDAQDRLTQQLTRTPTAAEVATELGMSSQEVADVEMASTGFRPVSLDMNADGDDSKMTVGEALVDPDDRIDSLVTRVATQTLVAALDLVLTPLQRRIVWLRYVEGRSQSQIAQVIGVSQAQVSRLQAQILTRLRTTVAASW